MYNNLVPPIRKYHTDPRAARSSNYLIRSSDVLSWDLFRELGAYCLYVAADASCSVDVTYIYYVRFIKIRRIGGLKIIFPKDQVEIRADSHAVAICKYFSPSFQFYGYQTVDEFFNAKQEEKYQQFIMQYKQNKKLEKRMRKPNKLQLFNYLSYHIKKSLSLLIYLSYQKIKIKNCVSEASAVFFKKKKKY